MNHLDIVTELGCQLGRPIPKGDAFIDWIANDDVLVACIHALLRTDFAFGSGYSRQPFSWQEIADGFCDLSHWRWYPPVEQLQLIYENARGEEQAA